MAAVSALLVLSNFGGPHKIGDHVTLMPGVNKVEADAWGEAKKIALVRHHLDVGTLKEVQSPRKSSSSTDLSSYPERQQMELVEQCADAELLSGWQVSGIKGKVAKAINDRLAELAERDGRS